jgi:hypothetical protein
MSYFWAYKANEPLGEFSPPETSTIAMPVTQDIFSRSFGTPNDLSIRFLEYNSNHTALKRVNYRYFRLDIPQGSVFLEARTIRHYIDYNQALCTGDDVPELTPAYYPSFAEVINQYDNSGFFWAYLEGGKIVWKEGSTPANAEDFCVLDHEILARPMLGANQVAKSQPDGYTLLMATSTTLATIRNRSPMSVTQAAIAAPGWASKTSRTGSALPPMDSGWTSSRGFPAAIDGQTSSMCAPRITSPPGTRWYV